MATISEKLDKVLENQAKQGVEIKNFGKDISEHHNTLYGNGKLGVVTDVDRLKAFKVVSCWFFGAIIIASITVAGKLIYNAMIT